jgi:hypothetical protein
MKNPILQLTFISQRVREREKKKERICEIFTCCSNCLVSSLLHSSRTVEQEKQYVESINVINYCTCNKAAIGQITHFHKRTLVLWFSFCFHFLQIQFLQDIPNLMTKIPPMSGICSKDCIDPETNAKCSAHSPCFTKASKWLFQREVERPVHVDE